MMRKNILSFLIAGGVTLATFGLYCLTDTNPGNAALASISVAAPDMAENLPHLRTAPFRPEKLMGMTGRDIRVALAEPGLIRRDAPTIVWQYRGDRCVLDLFFSTSDQDAAKAPVVHYEIRSREQHTAGQDPACRDDIAAGIRSTHMVGAEAFLKSR